MMISYEHILVEIEKQLQNAQTTNNAAAIREALTAIHSLSAVGLQSKGQDSFKTPTPPRAGAPITPHVLPLQQQQAPAVQSLDSMEGKPLEEEDGSNGESLFDF